jgi:hypothetical protein
MNQRALVSLAALAALFLSTGPASAQEDRGVRLRLGAGVEGGPFIVPSVETVGVLGGQGQVGFQFSNSFAIYAVGSGGVVVGNWSGLTYAGALLLELTFDHTILVGAGAELGEFVASGDGIKASGTLLGGRIHIAWCPGCAPEGNKLRQGFTVGVDIRLLGGAADFFASSGAAPMSPTSGSPFLISPTLNIGYLFF